ncbi:hypothetical protein ACRCUN_21160 [Mycobacterium sp. LTG2003]
MSSRGAQIVAMLLVSGLLAACGVVKNIDTEPLVNAVNGMPGVTKAWVTYDDDGLDSIATLQVQMPSATARQISDVVDTIEQERTSDSSDFLERVRLTVADKPNVSIQRDAKSLNGTEIADNSERLREFATTIAPTSPKAQVADTADQLTVRMLATPISDTLAALRKSLGDKTVRVQLLAESGDAPQWRVTLPLSAADERRINEQLAAVPAELTSVTVDNGTITGLGLVVSSQTGYQNLVETINVVGAGPDQPLWLTWHTAPKDHTQLYTGSVDVGGCDYPESRREEQPQEYLSPDELGLQEHLRLQFDTCPR